MRWSWQEFEDCPKSVVDELLTMLQEEHEEREREAEMRKFRDKVGGRGRL